MHTIINATAETPTHVRLAFAQGETVVIDFTPYMKQGGVFAPLQDPSFFAQVKIGERGRYITWSDDIEFCADALWLKAQEKQDLTGKCSTLC